MYKAVAGPLSTLFLIMLCAQASAGLDEVAALIEARNYQAALSGLSDSPETRQSRLLRANALTGLKHYAEAEAIYRSLIDEAPQDPTPYNNLASLYAASGRLQEASEMLTRGMKSDERYAAIYQNLSRVYVEMSRNSYAKALRMNEKQQGLQLVTLGHHSPSAAPVKLAAATSPKAAAVTKPAPSTAAQTPAEAATRPQAAVRAEPAKSLPQRTSPPPAAAAVPARAAAATGEAGFDAGGAIGALKRWAAAWSANDIETYLAAYDDAFLPPRDLSRAQWQAERRRRLKKPKNISVILSDFEVSSTGSNSLTVKLLQRYRSDNYRDTTRKGFILVRRNGKWKIGDEYTIEVIK